MRDQITAQPSIPLDRGIPLDGYRRALRFIVPYWPRLLFVMLVSGLMFGITVLGFVLNILSSYQYVRISALVLFDMRLALYRHLQTLSPRFWAPTKLRDVVARINNDIAEA